MRGGAERHCDPSKVTDCAGLSCVHATDVEVAGGLRQIPSRPLPEKSVSDEADVPERAYAVKTAAGSDAAMLVTAKRQSWAADSAVPMPLAIVAVNVARVESGEVRATTASTVRAPRRRTQSGRRPDRAPTPFGQPAAGSWLERRVTTCPIASDSSPRSR